MSNENNLEEIANQTAIFINISNKPFTGFWNGKAKTFQPGEKKFMPAYLARHYAKHLTNAMLLELGGKNEGYTSPKKPEGVPEFFNLFNKACIIQAQEEQDETEVEVDVLNQNAAAEPSMNMAGTPAKIVKPKGRPKKVIKGVSGEVHHGPGTEPQIVVAPDDGEDEEEFEGLADKK